MVSNEDRRVRSNDGRRGQIRNVVAPEADFLIWSEYPEQLRINVHKIALPEAFSGITHSGLISNVRFLVWRQCPFVFRRVGGWLHQKAAATGPEFGSIFENMPLVCRCTLFMRGCRCECHRFLRRGADIIHTRPARPLVGMKSVPVPRARYIDPRFHSIELEFSFSGVCPLRFDGLALPHSGKA